MIGWFVGWLACWLLDWLVCWLLDWFGWLLAVCGLVCKGWRRWVVLVDWLVGWLVGWLAGWLVGPTNKTNKQTTLNK